MTTASQSPSTWYVYTYADPCNTVFYVGKGTDNRINSHEREAKRGYDCKKCHKTREIWANGHPVKKRIVFETLLESEAFEEEKKLITQHWSDELVNLKNTPNKRRIPHEKFVHQGTNLVDKDREYLSPEEASSMLGVSRRTLERYTKEGRTQRYRRGIRVLFRQSDVERSRRQLDEPIPENPDGDE